MLQTHLEPLHALGHECGILDNALDIRSVWKHMSLTESAHSLVNTINSTQRHSSFVQGLGLFELGLELLGHILVLEPDGQGLCLSRTL